jgi:hypothetical protein
MANNVSSLDQIQILLDIFDKDQKQVMVLVTICFAIPAFTVSQLTVQEMGLSGKILLLVASAFFVLSGLLLFYYSQRQNLKRLQVVQHVVTPDVTKARDVLMGQKIGLWAQYGPLYLFGIACLWIASTVYVVFFAFYLFGGAPDADKNLDSVVGLANATLQSMS